MPLPKACESVTPNVGDLLKTRKDLNSMNSKLQHNSSGNTERIKLESTLSANQAIRNEANRLNTSNGNQTNYDSSLLLNHSSNPNTVKLVDNIQHKPKGKKKETNSLPPPPPPLPKMKNGKINISKLPNLKIASPSINDALATRRKDVQGDTSSESEDSFNNSDHQLKTLSSKMEDKLTKEREINDLNYQGLKRDQKFNATKFDSSSQAESSDDEISIISEQIQKPRTGEEFDEILDDLEIKDLKTQLAYSEAHTALNQQRLTQEVAEADKLYQLYINQHTSPNIEDTSRIKSNDLEIEDIASISNTNTVTRKSVKSRNSNYKSDDKTNKPNTENNLNKMKMSDKLSSPYRIVFLNTKLDLLNHFCREYNKLCISTATKRTFSLLYRKEKHTARTYNYLCDYLRPHKGLQIDQSGEDLIKDNFPMFYRIFQIPVKHRKMRIIDPPYDLPFLIENKHLTEERYSKIISECFLEKKQLQKIEGVTNCKFENII